MNYVYHSAFSNFQVEETTSHAWIPVFWLDDAPVVLDPYSPFVIAFLAWLDLGNVPEAA